MTQPNATKENSGQQSPATENISMTEFHDSLLDLTHNSWSTFFLNKKALTDALAQSELPLERLEKFGIT